MGIRRFLLADRLAFESSVPEQVVAGGPGTYIDHFVVAYSADLTAANSVPLTDFLGIVQPFQVSVQGNVVISLRGGDIFALNALWLGRVPGGMDEGVQVNDADRVFGMRLPLSYTFGPGEVIKWAATRATVTGLDGARISAAYVTRAAQKRPGFYSMVEIPGTAGAIGMGRAVAVLPNTGFLQGVLFYSADIPTVTADTATLQQIHLIRNSAPEIAATWADLAADSRLGTDLVDSTSRIRPVLEHYRFLDLSDDPWDLRESQAYIDAYFGVASGYRVVPIYTVEGRTR